MAVKWKDPKSGKEKTFLNPWEKGKKFFDELHSGVHLTNNFEIKKNKAGEYFGLTDTESAYRNGYLEAQKDSCKAYKAKQKKLNK